ncbi:MAG: peptidase T [bacterium]|nr:peptidase T [bacterium]
MKQKVLDKFIRYIKIDTQSDDYSKTYPSTSKQFDLAKLLVDELQGIGLSDANVDKNCYVTATLLSNLPEAKSKNIPVVGFIAHMDTATNLPGKVTNPQIITDYQGGDITFPNCTDTIISIEDNPQLNDCIGDTIITADGITLLGSDDKAGIAAIITMAEYLINNPDIKHGTIKIAFTPDEEVGQGVKYFDIKKFGADFAYTIDGGMPGRINKETFSADSATIEFYGKDIHPGKAKGKMINSAAAMADLINKLPRNMTPETTEDYEPYIHVHTANGTVTKSTVELLLRDFKTDGLNDLKNIIEKAIEETKAEYQGLKIDLKIEESYRNMAEYLTDKPEILDYLWKAAEKSGIKPEWEPIRGGTDGSKLSEMGLPTPNIYTGGNNCHSKTEWLSLNALEQTVQTIINLAQIIAE